MGIDATERPGEFEVLEVRERPETPPHDEQMAVEVEDAPVSTPIVDPAAAKRWMRAEIADAPTGEEVYRAVVNGLHLAFAEEVGDIWEGGMVTYGGKASMTPFQLITVADAISRELEELGVDRKQFFRAAELPWCPPRRDG